MCVEEGRVMGQKGKRALNFYLPNCQVDRQCLKLKIKADAFYLEI